MMFYLFVKSGDSAEEHDAHYNGTMCMFIALLHVLLRWKCSCADQRKHQSQSSTSLALVRGIHRSPVGSPHNDQCRGTLMLSLICAWTNGWENTRDAVDLKRHRAQYAVNLMSSFLKVKLDDKSFWYVASVPPSRDACKLRYVLDKIPGSTT